MKKAIVFHGTDANPEKYWYPWLARQLRDRGYNVEVPSYPDINRTPIQEFLPKVLRNHSFTDDTVLIGHSAGSPLVLSILQHTGAPVGQAILVAGFAKPIPGEGDPVLQDKYDWETIQANVKDLTYINSVNDPWGCDDKQGRYMFDHLGGTQIICNDGHFGSVTYNQPYLTFDLLNRLIP